VIRRQFNQLVCSQPKNERAVTTILTKCEEEMTREMLEGGSQYNLGRFRKQDKERVTGLVIR
jgi:hypothetical protein